MKRMGESEFGALSEKYTVHDMGNGRFRVYHAFADVGFDLEKRGNLYLVTGSTMLNTCGYGNSCFDRMAENDSDSDGCEFEERCVGPEIFDYMPRLYLASTFDPYVRKKNARTKTVIQKAGMLPILPQHLGCDNPQRDIYGGDISNHPRLTREEMGDLTGKWREGIIRACEGSVVVINRMHQDSSWEAGFIHGLGKPVLGIYYEDEETNPLSDLKDNWMVRMTVFIDIVKFPEGGKEGLRKLREKIYESVI